MAAKSPQQEVAAQRAYYAATAARYDEMHGRDSGEREHDFALAVMISFIDYLDVHSVLDIGAGTGRAGIEVRRRSPQTHIVGVEPSRELREEGYRKGLSSSDLVDGDAQDLDYEDDEFDMVCEFGALHHIPDPQCAVSEMLRVAKKAIFISDANNFGQGGAMVRMVKQIIDSVGLWPLANYIKTRGKGYIVTEGDGVSYSYSVFHQYPQIKSACRSVHFFNTTDAGPNFYRSASNLALLGIK